MESCVCCRPAPLPKLYSAVIGATVAQSFLCSAPRLQHRHQHPTPPQVLWARKIGAGAAAVLYCPLPSRHFSYSSCSVRCVGCMCKCAWRRGPRQGRAAPKPSTPCPALAWCHASTWHVAVSNFCRPRHGLCHFIYSHDLSRCNPAVKYGRGLGLPVVEGGGGNRNR